MKIENKVAVVTGGQSGLGRAVVEHFLAQGAKVAVFDLSAPKAAEFNADESQLKAFTVDVTNKQSVSAAVNQVAQDLGAVHMCVNCAGVAPAKKVLDRESRAMPLQDFQKVIDINLIGTFSVCALVAEKMAANEPEGEANERGVIINTASIAAYEGQKGQCAYAASKGAIASLTLPMARDLSSVGIRVATIAPGVMGTPMMLAMPEEVQQGLVKSIPFPKRLGLPEEFASLAAHIVDNSYINGEVIRLDGALRMKF